MRRSQDGNGHYRSKTFQTLIAKSAIRLAIDQGNTKTKWAVFRGKRLLKQNVLGRLTMANFKSLINDQDPSYVILSSTRHLSKSMQRYFSVRANHFILSEKLKFPFVIEYGTPNTLGKDRIAGVAGAWSIFPEENSLVIDAGSCITYDLVTATGRHLGGNISPGLHMRLNAMHRFTDKLPQVEINQNVGCMGIDTESALQVGAQMGAIHEIQGFLEAYKEKLIKLNILLTGGDAHFFVNRMKTKIFAAPQLVLQGLNEILEYNVPKLS